MFRSPYLKQTFRFPELTTTELSSGKKSITEGRSLIEISSRGIKSETEESKIKERFLRLKGSGNSPRWVDEKY